MPGRVSTTPRLTRAWIAFCTVFGLTECSSTIWRLEGNFAPGEADEIHFSSSPTSRAVLALFMTTQNSAIDTRGKPLSHSSAGLGWGFIGVASFSLTVPLTRLAVNGGSMNALFVGSARAVIAAALAAIALVALRQPLPRGAQWRQVAIVAGGVVVGFPLLTSFAMTQVPASHGAVVIALLPAATAFVAALRGRERPPTIFWLMAIVGALVAVTFAAAQGGGFGGLQVADFLLFGAVVAAAVGYAEGGLLSRELGAWQTVSWALVASAPLMLAMTVLGISERVPHGTPAQWAAFAYLSVVSMFLGYFAWYRGLAIGPMTQVSQIQLIQPVMSLFWAAALLGEHLTLATVLGGLSVVACSAITVRSRMSATRALRPTVLRDGPTAPRASGAAPRLEQTQAASPAGLTEA